MTALSKASTKEFYIQRVQPQLRTVKVREIARAMQVSQPYAAFIRSGRRNPHPRHWQALAKLVAVSVPGPKNESRWEKMTAGDVVLVYNSGRIRFAGEIAAKVRNKALALYFWKDEAGTTWELMYFIVNEESTDVPIEKLNPLFGYQPHYRPQGFSMINEAAISNFAQNYILGVLKTLERGDELIHLLTRKETLNADVDERIERVTTEHDEMQWRLIRLGQLARCNVWVPRSDQAKQYDGHQFRDFVLHEFHNTLDVPRSIENIDVVWKFGPYSIRSVFEIEHSTSVYLNLSD